MKALPVLLAGHNGQAAWTVSALAQPGPLQSRLFPNSTEHSADSIAAQLSRCH